MLEVGFPILFRVDTPSGLRVKFTHAIPTHHTTHCEDRSQHRTYIELNVVGRASKALEFWEKLVKDVYPQLKLPTFTS